MQHSHFSCIFPKCNGINSESREMIRLLLQSSTHKQEFGWQKFWWLSITSLATALYATTRSIKSTGLPLNNSWWNRKGPTYSDTTTPYERSFLLFFPTMQRKKSWSNYIKSSDLSSWQNSICFLCSPFASRITAAAAKKGSLRADLFTMAVSNSWFMHPGIALLQVTLEGLGSLVVVVTSFLSRWTKGESTARHSIDPLLLSSCLLCMGTSHLKVSKNRFFFTMYWIQYNSENRKSLRLKVFCHKFFSTLFPLFGDFGGSGLFLSRVS